MTETQQNTSDRRVYVVKLSHKKACEYFLQHSSYCATDLPPYINFSSILKDTSTFLGNKKLSNFYKEKDKPRNHDNVNHTILSNKDGQYAWRPFELIHPAIYVALVHAITEKENWKFIRNRFKEFSKNKKICCLSVPVKSQSNEKKDKAEQILNWWEGVEQKSLECALEYEYSLESDISNCYGAIYTHSIAWALHDKDYAKKNKPNKKLIGNIIDNLFQEMHQGQTNGIPQGSTLSDFIAEMVLGYADMLLSQAIKKAKIKDYLILRYRDDCRIYVKNLRDGEEILKLLSQVLFELNLKFNTSKTKSNQNIIQNSLKKDKVAWLKNNPRSSNLQKNLFLIHEHSMQHPNAGSLMKPLQAFYNVISPKDSLKNANLNVLISITTDIAYNNPKTHPICIAILSKLISLLDTKNKKEKMIKKIRKKIKKLPNTNLINIWLQRLSIPYNIDNKKTYNEPICRLVYQKATDNKLNTEKIWNTDWLECDSLKEIINDSDIVDSEEIKNLLEVISSNEFQLFPDNYLP